MMQLVSCQPHLLGRIGVVWSGGLRITNLRVHRDLEGHLPVLPQTFQRHRITWEDLLKI